MPGEHCWLALWLELAGGLKTGPERALQAEGGRWTSWLLVLARLSSGGGSWADTLPPRLLPEQSVFCGMWFLGGGVSK